MRGVRTPQWSDTIFDLLKAYSDQRTRTLGTRFSVKRAPVFAIDEARKRLEKMIGMAVDWSRLDTFMPEVMDDLSRSALASTFSASLEMARDGRLELRQMATFGPIFLRRPTGPRLVADEA